jgi:cell division septation protein DedD
LKQTPCWIQRAALRGAALLTAVLMSGCDTAPDSTELPPEAAPRGVNLVVGSTADQWSLVSLPIAGGVAEARDLTDPERVVWTGRTELPASVDAHTLRGGRIILRTAEGTLHSYDPESDLLLQVGEVPSEATWAGDRSVGLYVGADGSLVEIAPEGVWRYSMERQVAWASPAEGGVLVALEADTGQREIWLLRRDEDAPVETGTADARAPGIVTAWGRRAVFTTAAQQAIEVFTVSPIERAGSLDLGSPITAMSTSPSTHEIYLALDDPPRVVAVNRFNLTSRTIADLAVSTSNMRPTLFGEGILVAQGDRVSRLPVGGGAAARVPAEWRPDLPIGLPGGAVLAVSDGAVVMAGGASGTATVVDDAGGERWWLPMQWNPARATVTADRLTGEAEEPAVPPAEVAGPDSAVAETIVPGLRDRQTTQAAPGPPPGFYAIVGSARQSGGIRDLVQSLEQAGFATQVQSFPDEAGRTWFRGLVGPYRSRSEAEAAARQLLRERRLEAWVTEVAAARRTQEE